VAVLDYGFGNVRSAVRATARLGAEVALTSDPTAVAEADGLIVPGVGAFAACMAGLRRVGGPRLIERRLAGGRPVLGICVGMQVMFSRGEENGTSTEGLGEWPDAVTRLDAPVVPHMGWSPVTPPAGSAMFHGVGGERFYFVHSYAAQTFTLAGPPPNAASAPTPPSGIGHPAGELGDRSLGDGPAAARPSGIGHPIRPPLATWSEHGHPFVAAVEDGPLWATQFHPEKSGDAGAALLTNWLATL
jgi:glutamine amidotransferase